MTTRQTLPGTERLTIEGDVAAAMVSGIDQYLMSETETTREQRTFQADSASRRTRQQHLASILGLVDPRESGSLQVVSPINGPTATATGPDYTIFEVTWPVLKGIEGEGLLLVPDTPPVADAVVLPDCDISPEQGAGLHPGVPESAQVARRLVQNGCRVLIPVLMDRKYTHSGHPDIIMTNLTHREFIYRAAYELGRHIIGYEIQKILAAVDALSPEDRPLGLFGHGEGGLLAFYAAALDTRIQAAAVSGYFQPRESLWSQPIYRNLFGLLKEFGDAEIAALIAPRTLVVEIANHPDITEPLEPTEGEQREYTLSHNKGAPGRLTTPPPEAVRDEFNRASQLASNPQALILTRSPNDDPGADATLEAFLNGLGSRFFSAVPTGPPAAYIREGVSGEIRFKRQFQQLVDHTQFSLREAAFRRAEYWEEARDPELAIYSNMPETYRTRLWNDFIGPLPPITMSPNPRTRLLYDEPRLKAYEVMLDVYPHVFSYGILLVPKRIRKKEKRPVVVCQHGLEGRPQNIVDPHGPRHPYHNFAYTLAKQGFVTYAPQNPFIGQDTFRVLQRKANPLKLSLFSFIVRQHEQTLAWLSSLPFVDPDRIGLYGISYGGKTAMRVPAILEQYCLSICSADFNEWIWKNASTRDKFSYLFTGEYEMPEFNLGNTFNYAEMSWLICPRPFMVERGHHDAVGPDEWVSYEYAKTYRHYALQGLADRTEIEYFDGPHTINGEGTFAFLQRHLNWPPKPREENKTMQKSGT